MLGSGEMSQEHIDTRRQLSIRLQRQKCSALVFLIAILSLFQLNESKSKEFFPIVEKRRKNTFHRPPFSRNLHLKEVRSSAYRKLTIFNTLAKQIEGMYWRGKAP